MSEELEIENYTEGQRREYSSNDLSKIMTDAFNNVKHNLISWLIVVPVVNIFVTIAIIVVVLGILTGVGTAAMTYTDYGLMSGNPVPFIGLTIGVIVIFALLGAFSYHVQSNLAVKTLKETPVEVTTIFENRGSFKKIYFKIVKGLIIFSALIIPFLLLAFGANLLSNTGLLVGSILAAFIAFLILSPIMQYVPLNVVRNDIIGIDKGTSIKDTLNLVKGSYIKVIFYEILFFIINFAGALFVITAIFTNAWTMSARACLLDSLAMEKN